jgi:hypothetical protein
MSMEEMRARVIFNDDHPSEAGWLPYGKLGPIRGESLKIKIKASEAPANPSYRKHPTYPSYMSQGLVR